jgi:hypothetical protein
MKVANMTKRVLSIVLLAGICACEEEPIDNSYYVPTREMSIEAHVSEINNSIVNVEVMLRNGTRTNGIDISLDQSDSLFASSIGDFSDLLNSGDHYKIIDLLNNNVSQLEAADGNSKFFANSYLWYQTSLPIENADSEISILLLRNNRLEANGSNVRLPADYQLITPTSGTVFSTASDIPIAWSITGDPTTMQASAVLDCIDGYHSEWKALPSSSENGQLSIPADTFNPPVQPCNLNIRLERTQIGNIDPLFGNGGIIVGHRFRQVGVSTIP